MSDLNKSVEIPDWLLEMSKQMSEQPSRCTAHPFWQVRTTEYLPTKEGYNEHHVEVCGEEGIVYSSLNPLSELVDYLIENHEEWCIDWSKSYDDEVDDWKDCFDYFDLDEGDLPDDLRLIHVQEVEKVVSTHLTEADAEWFIARKQHDYPKLYTYVESAYWSPQLKQLQDWIIALTPSPQGVQQ